MASNIPKEYQKSYTWDAIVFTDGATYEGLVSELGQCEKLGVFQYVDGDRYEGQYFEGMMHGYGVYTWAQDDSTYFGEWNKNSQNGCGVKLYGSGALEVGEWKDDQYLGEYTGRCGEREQNRAMMQAMEAATRAKMFTGKPDGEVVILRSQEEPEKAANQHPVVYDKGTEWMMPGYKGEEFDMPENFAATQPALFKQMATFNRLWERAWRYYNVDVPESESDAKMREVKFLTDEPATMRTVDEDYDEYEDEDEEDEDEDDEPVARSRRGAGPAALSLSMRNANPVAMAFARMGRNKKALRMNPLKAASNALSAARERLSSVSKVSMV